MALQGSWRLMITGRTRAGRTVWLLLALLLLIVPGCFSISGPGAVSGPKGGLVTIQCRYDPDWETYKKWWGRGNSWGSCQILIKTTGSEQEVKKGRVSIQDDHRRHTFTVAMEELRSEDADTYWCGIERTGADLGVQVQVIFDPAYSTTPPILLTKDRTEPVTTDTPAGLASSPPITQSVNSSHPLALTGPLTRALLCNIHFVLLAFVKVPVLGILLWTVMWLSRSRGDPRGN